MSDTPRTDAVWELFATDTTLEPDVEFSTLARQLERELNAAHVEIERLTAKVAQLYEGGEEQKQRIKRLEEAGNALLWYFCPKNTGDISFLQSEAIKQWNKAKEAK